MTAVVQETAVMEYNAVGAGGGQSEVRAPGATNKLLK